MRDVPSTKRVKIGVAGGGFGASFQWHLHPDCQVVAVCDERELYAAHLGSAFHCRREYTDYEAFLKHPDMNAVAVFTPAPLHAEMSIQAMEAGKHVISAVPAGMNIEELERLLECVNRTGLNYMMAETSYYRPEIITCREWSEEGRFGTIFYAESEYHHHGLIDLMFDDEGKPNWRHGLPPMLYPTHNTGMVVPVMNERLVEVQAIGWGDDHPILKENAYNNPFWNTTAFFKTSGGNSARISICWHGALGGTERGSFYGDKLSYVMARPEGSPNAVVTLQDGKAVSEPYAQPDHFDRLPEPMRVKTGHGNSHTFLTYEFVQSIIEQRRPAIDIHESLAYTVPGIIAHESALRGGESMKIPDYGKAD
jgi:predicted dehydrogenase